MAEEVTKAFDVRGPATADLRSLQRIRIASPYLVTETLWNLAPASLRQQAGNEIEHGRRFEPIDRRGFEMEPSAHGIDLYHAHAGHVRMADSISARGMAMTVLTEREPGYTLSLRQTGSVSIEGAGKRSEGSWDARTGVIYRERKGARIAISDRHAGMSFEIPHDRVVAILEGLIDRRVNHDIDLEGVFSTCAADSAPLARVVAFVRTELENDGFQPLFGRTIEDLLIRTVLLTQPHAYTGALEAPAAAAVPYNVKRAIDFMHAHAREPLTIEEIAAAAGCSVRSLQSAFRRFTDQTPMERLRRIRLEQSRRDLLAEDLSTAELARRYQFSNAGRFSAQFRRLFDHRPNRIRR